ncbi:MAG: polysaccharide deacetylase family protein [Coriobacteriia bacterium]|nr:polysaccharide deacetylase family protein [Coriobacteriia bacterium]
MSIRRRIARGARVVLVVLLLGIVVPYTHQGYAAIAVTVNGESVSLARGATVEDAIESCDGLRNGRVWSVASHRVLSESVCRPGHAQLNGASVPLSAAVRNGDRIETVPGEDVVEPVVEEFVEVEVPARTIGAGSVPKVAVAGTPTVLLVTKGAVSGETVTTETVSVGVPAVVRMVPEPGANVVALTFDDGPWPGQTEQVLAILQERNVPATFFMLGMRVERAPDLARSVVNAGHLVGNHTYWHVDLSGVQPDVAQWEIEATSQLILETTGVRPAWIRAPGGRLGGPAQAYIAQTGMRHALWTVDPQDWNEGKTPEDLAWSVISSAHPGAVIVLHDGGGNQATTIAALPLIIDGLRYYGYEFVTLDELPTVRSDW